MLRISAFFWVAREFGGLIQKPPSLEPYLRDTASIFTQGWRVFFVRPYVHGYAAYACLIDFVDNFTTGWVEISLNSQAVVDSNLKLQTSLDSKLKKIKHIFRSVLFFKIKVGFLLVLYYMNEFSNNCQYSRTRRWRKFQKGKIYNAEEHVAIESFVTTLIHWTFFSDDANKVGICWLCRSGQLHVTPSSRWSLPRCHRSVRNDMRLFLRTKQYPVQLRTTKYYSRRYYSSTTKY